MAVNIGSQIDCGMPHANLDILYGPYDSLQDALNAMPVDEEGDSQRHIGLTVGILTEDGVVEYWFKAGIEDEDLIVKINAQPQNVNIYDVEIDAPKQITTYEPSDSDPGYDPDKTNAYGTVTINPSSIIRSVVTPLRLI